MITFHSSMFTASLTGTQTCKIREIKHDTLHIAKPLQRRPLQTPASLTVHCQTKEALAHSSSSQSSAVCVVYNRIKLDKNTVPPSYSAHSTPTFFPREHAQGDRVILQMPPSILGASSNCEQDFFFPSLLSLRTQLPETFDLTSI